MMTFSPTRRWWSNKLSTDGSLLLSHTLIKSGSSLSVVVSPTVDGGPTAKHLVGRLVLSCTWTCTKKKGQGVMNLSPYG